MQVGNLLRLMNHHPYRPAHVHFLVVAPGFEPLVTHVFPEGSPYLDSDVVFGTKAPLVRAFAKCEAEEWTNEQAVWKLSQDFVLAPEAADDAREQPAVTDAFNYVPRGSASNFDAGDNDDV